MIPELQEVPKKSSKAIKIDKDHPSMTSKMKAQRDKDRQMIRGKFIYHEVSGGFMEFSFLKYPGDEVINYTMYDGDIYTIPLMVYKHLNENLAYPIHAYAIDENGKSIVKVGQKVRRCSFQSLEFLDIEDMARPDLVTVEHI